MDIAIVMPVYNQLGYTQGCLASLATDIANGVRVIVVNNGSTDGTREWLDAQKEIRVIHNDSNRGCAPAWNQGSAAAGGAEWIVILNNDVQLPVGWLRALLDVALKRRWGVVCPAMREGVLNYAFAEYAKSFMAVMRGAARPGHTHGVCFAVNRAVFEKIGYFDEAFRIGQFEDSDFFRRVVREGFGIGTTGACFIHHFGSATQNALREGPVGGGYEAENRAYFRRKWKLGWCRRRWERWRMQLRNALWRIRERIQYGHTLHEKWLDGRLRYY
jgi:GT2 family glycosyltransferase